VARAQDVDDFDDDEALSWAGDEEQGRAAPRLREADPVVAAAEAEPEQTPGSRGRSAATAVFAVPYLALTVGWIFAVQLFDSPDALFPGILWQFGEFLAMLVAPLWFAATLTLTRPARPAVRVGWLAIGLVVLLPWPVILRLLFALTVTGSIS
jgi:hypothetical protein